MVQLSVFGGEEPSVVASKSSEKTVSPAAAAEQTASSASAASAEYPRIVIRLLRDATAETPRPRVT
jgi:hypothetical protein